MKNAKPDKFADQSLEAYSPFPLSPMSLTIIAVVVVVLAVSGVAAVAMCRSGMVLFSWRESSRETADAAADLEPPSRLQAENRPGVVDISNLEQAALGHRPVVLAVAPTNPNEGSDAIIGRMTSGLRALGRTPVTIYTEDFYADGGFASVWHGDTTLLSVVRQQQPRLREHLLVRFTRDETTQSEFEGFVTTRGSLSIRLFRGETLAQSLTVSSEGLGASERSSTIECCERLYELAAEQMAQQEWWK